MTRKDDLGTPGDAKPDEACGRGIGAVRIVAATRIGVLINVVVLDGVGPMQLIPCLRRCLELRGGVPYGVRRRLG